MFKLHSGYKPAGDQPKAIASLVSGIGRGDRFQTLLGVTGSGKTFTMANVIAQAQRPALVLAHNKTLAAQLCQEFREFFPENEVHYFVSYYDYYQPEAYLPRTDTYIEKESQINQEIDRLRHAATQALLTRRDVIVVSSVSCIYALGSPKEYQNTVLHVQRNGELKRNELVRRLIEMQFERTTADITRGHFRARGDVLEVMPMNEEVLYRLTFEEDKVATISVLDAITRQTLESPPDVWIFPAKHYVVSPEGQARALRDIKAELTMRLKQFDTEGKVLESERLSRRTRYDLEMIKNVGYCNGVENYSRHFDGRAPGEPPYTLLDYFPKDYLLFIDESHVTVPQIGGMYEGDRARKETLIEHGFRLPSAKDNRPLKFDEFEQRMGQTVFVSATPSKYEAKTGAQVVEQIIRPTGLVDPEVEVRPITPKEGCPGQIDDLIEEIVQRVPKGERVLVTTLTKKMAEDLTNFLKDKQINVQYLHSDVETLERITILSDLRKGKYDVLVGVNLLREGLDLPEVTLVAILDADKEGFLRSETSIIQTIGRAARNVDGKVILYADHMTGSLDKAMKETLRRRTLQLAYNQAHGITPKTIKKTIKDIREMLGVEVESAEERAKKVLKLEVSVDPKDIEDLIKDRAFDMKKAARALDFETAAILRDEIVELKKELKERKK
jgi:excinuclease ABC subunit B